MFDLKTIFGKQVLERPGAWLGMDMHAHWLPGIDDGAATVDESLTMVREFHHLGYRKLVATPHIYPDLYPNDRASIQAAFDLVAPLIRKEFPDLEIGFAAEYFIDENFESRIEAGQLLTVVSNFVLVEFSFIDRPHDAANIFFKMGLKGYTPVLAHVERYPYYFGNMKQLEQFYHQGVQFQANLLSFAGHYGEDVKKQAEKILGLGWYKWMGTDAHREAHLKACGALKLSGRIHKMLEGGLFNKP